MSIRSYLFSLYSSTLVALAVWLSIVFFSDPDVADMVTMMAFFVSFFIWFSGLLTFLIFQTKIIISRKEVIFAHLPSSTRQASFFSATLTLLAVLQLIQVLSWWSTILVIAIFILFELFFRSKPTDAYAR